MGFAWQVYEPGLWQEGRNGGKVTRGEESFNTLKLRFKSKIDKVVHSGEEVHSLGRGNVVALAKLKDETKP